MSLDNELFEKFDPVAPKKARAGGLKAQQNGKEAEDIVDDSLKAYGPLIHWFAGGLRFTRTRTLGAGKSVGRARKGPVDRIIFYGHFPFAIPVVFDVKSTDKDNIFELRNIEDHQFDFMASAHNARAVAFLVIRFRKLDRWFVLRFQALQVMWGDYLYNRDINPKPKRGYASIPLSWFVDNCKEIKKDGDRLLILEAADVERH